MTQADPKNVEEWIANASEEERFTFLKERLEETQGKIAELEAKVSILKENRNLMYQVLITHKHDNNGNPLIPAGFVTFND